MADLTTYWRPRQRIRAVAIAIIRRGPQVLVAAVLDDNGAVKGWRPLGGGINFGEPAETAIRREIREELDVDVQGLHQIAVMENLFDHRGATGHEIVFVFDVAVEVPPALQTDRFVVEDEGVRFEAGWIDLALFRDGTEQLYPDGLLAHL